MAKTILKGSVLQFNGMPLILNDSVMKVLITQKYVKKAKGKLYNYDCYIWTKKGMKEINEQFKK